MEHGTQKLTLDMFLLNRLYRVESLMIFSLQASKSELPWNAMKLGAGTIRRLVLVEIFVMTLQFEDKSAL